MPQTNLHPIIAKSANQAGLLPNGLTPLVSRPAAQPTSSQHHPYSYLAVRIVGNSAALSVWIRGSLRSYPKPS
jgi:hypothetical protein